MREIPNELFPGGKGTMNIPIIRTRDLIVVRTFSPRRYANQDGENECSVLPEIIICQASKDAPIKINGKGIIAKGPVPAYVLQFNPVWEKEYEKGKDGIYRFLSAFIPEEEKNMGDIAVYKRDITGLCDKREIPGEISYTGIDNRDVTLHGQIGELEIMLNAALDALPKKRYELQTDIHLSPGVNKYYNIIIRNEEMERFSKSVVGKIF